jgi:NAD+ kinase
MSDSAVGVVGDTELAERLRSAGHAVTTGTPDDVPETDTVVAVGQSAVGAVAAAAGDPLVVPVDAGRGVRSVAPSDLPSVLDGLVDAHVERHPVFTVRAAGSAVGTAAFEATVVTAEAARISAYAVETARDTVGRFRADGVTVATPAGSADYARRVGGPVVAPADAMGVVAPIAPFHTDPDHWVLTLSALSVTVTRDEATVALYVDGDRAATVEEGESVTFERTGTLRVAVRPENGSRYA